MATLHERVSYKIFKVNFKNIAAVSSVHSAPTWVDRMVEKIERTGLGTGYINMFHLPFFSYPLFNNYYLNTTSFKLVEDPYGIGR